MVRDSRSCHKAMDNEASNSYYKPNGSKGSTSGSPSNNSFSLRRSTREPSSKKQSSPLSARKSERLGKRIPISPAKKQVERAGKHDTPSPLRRSERGRNVQPSTPPSSRKSDKGSGSPDLKHQSKMVEKSEKNWKNKDATQCVKEDLTADGGRNKRLDARKYRALFKSLKTKVKVSDSVEQRRLPENSPSDSSSSECGGSGKSQDGEEDGATSNREKSQEVNISLAKDSAVKQSKIPMALLRDSCSSECGGSGNAQDGQDDSIENCREKSQVIIGLEKDGALPGLCSELKRPTCELSDFGQKHDSAENFCGSKCKCPLPKSGDDACNLPLFYEEQLGKYGDLAERVQLGSCNTGKLQEKVHSSLEQKVDGKSGLQKCEDPTESKSKRNMAQVVLVTPEDGRREGMMGPGGHASSSEPVMNCSVEEPTTCSKRHRVDDMEKEVSSLSTKSTEELPHDDVVREFAQNESSITTHLARKLDQKMPQKDSLLDNQMAGGDAACFTCKLGGELLFCNGRSCKRRYHLTCVDPKLKDTGPGTWHCPSCVKRKIEHGVHSVSEGVESVWNVRDIEVLSSEGVQWQKQYFVKYKDLAHAHNAWVPEANLLNEAPLLVARFEEKKEATQWKPEWSVPHRLLKKRVLMIPNNHKYYIRLDGANDSNCENEWLVKWRGLDYDNLSWELENAPFFNSPECKRLIEEYIIRHEKKSKSVRSTIQDEVQERGSLSSIKLPNVSGGNLSGSDSGYLQCVNKLRDCWLKGHNSIIIDEQDRVPKIVSLILLLQSSVAQPFLVITPSPLHSSWEAEFVRLAPSINLVVYHGSRYAREIIRKLEFCEDGDVMFEVLLSSPEVLYEDLGFLSCIHWGAVFIDDCQHPDISAHFSNIKKLTTHWRLLIANSQLKDSVADYHNILSMLYSDSKSSNIDDLTADSNLNLSLLKERLSPFVVYGCKSDPPKFLEFWVPVQISNLQLEQYCSSLLSSSAALRSCSKSDPVGALRDILISTRKCCDHPYLVNNSLQSSLTGGRSLVDIVDIGVNSSGKLQLLDAILTEIKKHGLRVLILFQSIGGSGRDSIGDILDDVLHQRFGQDSYERIDGGGCIPSKKQAALNKFNKEKGRFIFLLETRACLPSIKLTSVDIVIVFDSDWNPLNDLRALQRISIDSGSEQIYVFRLYSSCTIEEKVLMLAKKDVILDSTLQFISPSTSHMLLMWGASYLFTKLDEFHQDDSADRVANIAPANSLFKNVLQELSLLIEKQTVATKFITKAQTLLPNGGNYINNTLLLGEQQIKPLDEGLPHVFWTNLLDGRQPKWIYLSGTSQRNRKRVQYFEDSVKKIQSEKEESSRKRRKVDHSINASSSPKIGTGEETVSVNEGDAGLVPKSNSKLIGKTNTYLTPNFGGNNSDVSPTLRKDKTAVPEVPVAVSEEKRKSRDARRRLYHFLKPKITELCKILQLPEELSNVAERFLEYLIDNHRVSQESESILQAFQICVCWTAASLLNHKIDHKESLELAKRHLMFSCKEDDADFLFKKMQFSKKTFSLRSEDFKEHKCQNDHSPAANGHTRERLNGNDIEAAVAAEGGSPALKSVDKQVLPPIEISEMAKREITRNIKKVVKKSKKRMEKLIRKQHSEVEEFNRNWVEKKTSLEKEHRMRSTIISSIHSSIPIRTEMLKNLDSEFEKKLQELDSDMALSLKKLEARQQDEKAEEKVKATRFLEEVRSWAQDFGNGGDLLLSWEQFREHEGSNGSASTSLKLQENQNPDRSANCGPGNEGTSSEIARVSDDETCATDKVRNNALNDTSENIQGEQLHKNSTRAVDGDASCGPATAICTTYEPTLRRSDEMVPLVSSSALKEFVGGINNQQMPDPLVESDRYSDHINALASDRNINRVTSQNIGASHCVTMEPADCQPSLIDSHMVPVAEQGDSLDAIQGHGDEPCEPHGKEMQGPTERGAEKMSSMLPAEASSSGRAEGLESDQLPDEVEVNLPTRFTVSASPSSTPLGNEQSVLPVSENQLVPEPSVQNPNCADILNRGSLQPSIENPVRPANGPNLVRYELNSATRGLAASSECSHPPPFMAPMIPHNPLHSSSDPLHNELERLRKESEEATRLHEEMILGLNSDREKEIEEMVNQIRRKYETKIQEADALYALKKQQLDMNHNKVLMNKILAETFRSKCTDHRPGTRHDLPSSRIPQVLQSQQIASRPSVVECTSVTSGPQNAVLGMTNSSLALFSSIPSRPPQICPAMPIAANPQVRSDLRAPAPHLQCFRPPMFSSSGSLSSTPCGALNRQSSSSPSASSPNVPALMTRPQQAALPTYLSGSRGWSHQPESVVSPVHQSSPLSAMEFLVGVSTQSGANQESSLPSLPDHIRNYRTSDLSEFATPANIQPSPSDQATAPANVGSSHQGTAENVVCLSDDD